MAQSFREEAIPLITYDGVSRSYALSAEAGAMISQITNPIAVISVAGLYRTGKSYLLNRVLLNRGNGFGVGPTVNPCTKGLWVWGTPIVINNISILVVDCEGTGATTDSDLSHDTRIFALSVLLASTFVYNSVGAIDEGALESLSLVVNLTKFLQLRASDDESQDEYSQFMPSFLWVLRDFSLQLLDSNGDQLTSNQYLERSLSEQPGFSDDIELKNRIRRLLRTFFPDRDCQTLVRPVLQEKLLQELPNLNWDRLRPEFTEQALGLRKGLFSRIKPKSYKGKTLNGSMYLNLVNSYVQAINNGGIANIENSWTYVFREECRKTQQESMDAYDKGLKELAQRMPISSEDLTALHRIIKQKALAPMKLKEDAEVYIQELKTKIKAKFANLMMVNDQESSLQCKQFLQREFAPIDRKLKQNEYRNYLEYEKDLRLFDAFLEEHGPKVSKRRIFFNEFMIRQQQEGAQFFVQTLSSQNEYQRKQYEDQIAHLEKEVAIIRRSGQETVERLEQEVRSVQQRELVMRQKSEAQKEEFETVRRGQAQSLTQQQEEVNRINLQLETQTKMRNSLEEQLRVSEREQFILRSESQKREALLEQKVQHLQLSLEEHIRREKTFENALAVAKQEATLKGKDVQSYYERSNQELKQQLQVVSDRLQETGDTLAQQEIKFEGLLHAAQQREEQALNQLKRVSANASQYQEQLNQEINRTKALQEQLMHSQLNQEHYDAIETLKQQLKQSEIKCTEQKQNFIKQEAIQQQQMTFLQMDIEEKKQQILDLKKSHDSALQALECSQTQQSTQQTANKQLFELKETHLQEMRQLEQQFQTQKKQLQSQIDTLQSEVSEEQLKSEGYRAEITRLQEEQCEIINEIDALKRSQQVQKQPASREKEIRQANRIKQLEEELSVNKNLLQQEQANQNTIVEQQISELRNYYEMEKDVLERRIHEERLKADQKYAQMMEEQDVKFRDELQQAEEEIENLRDELRELELTLQQQQQHMENELELKAKSVNHLEGLLQESKEQVIQLQANCQQQLDARTAHFAQQTQNLDQQIQQLTIQNHTMNRDNQILSQKLETLDIRLTQKQEELKNQCETSERALNNANERCEDYKNKYISTCDEYLEKKINYEKAIALSAQQNEFLVRKVEELERSIENSNQKYEERLRVQKQEWAQELNEKIVKLTDERVALDAKVSILKKQLRESQSLAQKLQQEQEKGDALSSERIQHLEGRIQELEQQNSSDMGQTLQQVKTLKEQLSQQKMKAMQEIESVKFQLNTLEYSSQEMSANYEKDKILWTGKFQFLEAQRDSLKQEHAETLKKFEATIQSLQRARALERNDHNQDVTEMLNSIERKYQDQNRDLADQHTKKCEELQDRINVLEREAKQQASKDLFEQQSKLGGQFERKLTDLLENEKRMHAQIEELKQERDQYINDHMDELEHEKEFWKQKINELEDRVRESDKKHSQLIFFHEKERAKWNQEKDYLVQQRLELQDSLSRLEKKKELLLRDNEKMKNNSKSQRKYNPNQTYVNNLNTSYLRQGSENKIGKEVNMSYDVTKSLEEETQKENLSTSSTFGSFKKYYQMMNSKHPSPSKE